MKKTILVLRYLLTVHVVGILFCIILRTILYLVNANHVSDVSDKGSMFFKAYIIGLQFDSVIACYIIFAPLLLLSIIALFNRIYKSVVVCCNLYIILTYSLVFTVAVADIPYFSYFFTHLSASAFNWFEFGNETAGIIFTEKSYYPYFALLITLITLFSIMVFYTGKKLYNTKSSSSILKGKDYTVYIPLTLLIWLICATGMRGSFQRYPLQTGYAYFSDNSFFNQFGLNPTFYLLKSYSSKKGKRVNASELMPVDEAIRRVQKEFGITDTNDNMYPINRLRPADGDMRKANVVIILMESMSTACLEYEYNGKNLTPFLNELISKSYYLENFYSSGIHTNNGIMSSLYGYPVIFDKPAMKHSSLFYTGLPYYLHQHGYKNMFFITGNPNYDHMNLFLHDNHFDRIYSTYDYPSEKVVNNFGVQDDFLLEYGIERLNEAAMEKERPFMAAFLTVSNHSPIIVPPSFRNAGGTDEQKILSFADNCLKNFMEAAAKEEWYNNTVFVLLGDHGAISGKQKYDMFLSYNHIPCIIFSPLFDDMPKRFKQYCGQIDLFPTLMGLLNCPYVNNSFGIDIMKETRPYMFFVTDRQLGCINENYFYVRNQDSQSDFLYNLHDEQNENYAEKLPEVLDSIKNYAMSMIVAADYLIEHNRTGSNLH